MLFFVILITRKRVGVGLAHSSEGGEVLEPSAGMWWRPTYCIGTWWRASQVMTEKCASLGLSFPAYEATNSIMGSLPVSYYLSKDIHPNVIYTWIQGSSLQYMNFSEYTQIIVQVPPNQVFSYFHVLQFSRHLDHQSMLSHVKQETVADGT